MEVGDRVRVKADGRVGRVTLAPPGHVVVLIPAGSVGQVEVAEAFQEAQLEQVQ